ncbi:integrase arm-type DNA-binding domain-containing protein [Sphingomonas sp. I4]
MLTNAALKSARPKSRAYKMWDTQGLYLFVAPSGLRAWRVRIRADRQEAVISLGQWPNTTLDEARAAAGQARAIFVHGMQPREIAAQLRNDREQAAITIKRLARDWHASRRDRWVPVHATDVLASLERHVFPVIGDELASAVTTRQLLRLLDRISAVQTARRIAQRLSQIFRFALARSLVDANPAAGLVGELATGGAVQRQPALVDLDEARALLDAADRARVASAIRLASRFWR